VLPVVVATVLLIGASIFSAIVLFHHDISLLFDASGGSCGGG
jgi:hypothetical protein